ncbi:MAG: secondary thiamine-phosphate synthase enzyme YjbQ [Chloroflexota bacterium]
MEILEIRSHQREELIDITDAVRQLVAGEGAVLVYVPHTTAGVLINEHADPDVARDILSALNRMVPEDGYRHAEGNSPAHVKASLVGSSCLVPVAGGRLGLGTWQGIFFAEFDGPGQRTALISQMG